MSRHILLSLFSRLAWLSLFFQRYINSPWVILCQILFICKCLILTITIINCYNVARVLQEDTLAPYLFIICLDYVLKTSIDKIKENSFELIKKRSRRYPSKTITDADYADDISILANTPNQAETLLHSFGTNLRRHWPLCQCTQN